MDEENEKIEEKLSAEELAERIQNENIREEQSQETIETAKAQSEKADDEETDDSEQKRNSSSNKSYSRSRSGGNRKRNIKKAAEMVKNSSSENRDIIEKRQIPRRQAVETPQQPIKEQMGSQIKNEAGKQVANRAKEQAVKEGTKKAATSGGAKAVGAGCGGGCATAAGIILVIILIIMLLIGVISFMNNMPDSTIGKITEWLDNTFRGVKVAFSGNIGETLAKEKLEDTAQYIENMGYDLQGYGFLDQQDDEANRVEYYTFQLKGVSSLTASFHLIYNGIEFDVNSNEYIGIGKNIDEQKQIASTALVDYFSGKDVVLTVRVTEKDGNLSTEKMLARNSDGKITYVKSRALLAYISAEERTYMFKGQYFNFREWWENDSALGKLFGANKDDEDSRQGMIVLPNKEGVTIDRAERTLNIENKIKNPNATNSDGEDLDVTIKDLSYAYDLVGWTGKYGKPIEFSLAMHLATMSPDFTYKFVTDKDLDTVVNMKYEEVPYSIRLLNKDGSDAQTELGQKIASNIQSIINTYKSYGTSAYRYDYEAYYSTMNSPEVAEASFGDGARKYEKYLLTQNKDIMNHVESALSVLQDAYASPSGDLSSDMKVISDYFGVSGDISKYNAIATFNNAYKNLKLNIPYIESVENHWYRNLYFGGVSHYGSSSGGSANVGNGGATSEENAPLIWKFLIGMGLTDEGAAGLMGNLEAEGSFLPNNLEDYVNEHSNISDEEFTNKVNSGEITRDVFIQSMKYTNTYQKGKYGYGIVQWTDTGRKANLYDYLKSHNYQINSLQGQLEFLYQELLTSYTGVLNLLRTTKSVDDASDKVLLDFEAPGAKESQIEKRRELSKKWYEKFHGKTIETPGTNTNTTGDTSSNGNLIFIGDSNTTHIYYGVTGKNIKQGQINTDKNGNIWIAKQSMGFSWLKNTAVPLLEQNNKITNGTKVIILLGINQFDATNNPKKYANYLNQKAMEWKLKGATVYFVSLNPVQSGNSENIKSSDIEKFNNNIKKLLSGVGYIDTYSQVKNKVNSLLSGDGIHFNMKESKIIYDLIIKALNVSTDNTTTNQTSGDSNTDNSGGSSASTATAPQFNKFDLTDAQLRVIARIARSENSSSVNAYAAELSQMCNLYDIKGQYTKHGSSFYEYILYGGWYAAASKFLKGKFSVNDGSLERFDKAHPQIPNCSMTLADQIIRQGKRTLPGYVDTHDYKGDIAFVKIDGVRYNTNGGDLPRDEMNRAISEGKKVRLYGSEKDSGWTLYCFPSSKSDPFGYTTRVSEEMKQRIGEGHYDVYGNPVDGWGASANYGGTGFCAYQIDSSLYQEMNLEGSNYKKLFSGFKGISSDNYNLQIDIPYGIKQVSEPLVYDNSKRVKELLGYTDQNISQEYIKELKDVTGSDEITTESLQKLEQTYKEKYKYYIFDGKGRSQFKENIAPTKSSLSAMAILESVHTEDAAHILKDFKELFNDLKFETEEEQEDISSTEKNDSLKWIFKDYIPSYDWPAANEIPVLEGDRSTLSTRPFAYVIKHVNESEETNSEETDVTLNGFTGKQELIAPGNCIVEKVNEEYLQLRFVDVKKMKNTQLKIWDSSKGKYEITTVKERMDDNDVNDMVLYIYNINVANGITEGAKLEVETTIGTTIEGKNLELVMKDQYGSPIVVSDYIHLPELPENLFAGNQIVEIAKRLHDKIRHVYSYPNFGAKEHSDSIKELESGTGNKKIDCSSFVSWVLYEAGYSEFSTNWSSNDFKDRADELCSKYGWQKITPLNSSTLQPGDILVVFEGREKGQNHHVEVYAGNGRSYSAGGNNSINADTISTNYGKFEFALRVTMQNSGPGVSMNYETGEGGDGYSKTITVAGKTYKIYKQGNYKKYSFWGGTISSHGCGPTSVAIVASGYGKNTTPVDASRLMSSGSLEEVSKALNSLGISHSSAKTVNTLADKQKAINEIRQNFATGKPVIVLVGKSSRGSNPSRYTGGGHFMVLLGEKDGKLIIGQPSGASETGELDDFLTNYMVYSKRRDRGYILIQQ